jgi:Fe-S-cluster containining protein
MIKKLSAIPGKGVCNECGYYCTTYFCCKQWRYIDLSKGDIRKLAAVGYQLNKFMAFDPDPKMKQKGPERKCIFLEKDGKCEVHRKYGKQMKPYACRKFPHQELQATEDDMDFVFYHYEDKVFTRDVLIDMLDACRSAKREKLFEQFSLQLEILRSQKDKYIDFFNFRKTKPLLGFLGTYWAAVDAEVWTVSNLSSCLKKDGARSLRAFSTICRKTSKPTGS